MSEAALPTGTEAPSVGPEVVLEEVHLAFGPKVILDGVNMHFRPGEVACVIGPSGCGKSTTLKLISGLLKPQKGRVLVGGQDVSLLEGEALKAHRLRLGFMFQGGALFDSMTVGENIGFPLTEHTSMPADQLKTLVAKKLEMVGMKGFEGAMPANLSGGQVKRIGLARAIARDPGVLMADEPTAGLDPITSTVVERLLIDLAKRAQATGIVVTHQQSTIFMGDTITMLHGGKVVGTGTPDEMRGSQVPLIRDFLEGRVAPKA